MFGFTKINLLFHYYFYFNAVNQERKSLRSKYLAPKVDNLKSTKPSQWWNAVNRMPEWFPAPVPTAFSPVYALTWKYVDDTTISQTIPRGPLGDVQQPVIAVED